MGNCIVPFRGLDGVGFALGEIPFDAAADVSMHGAVVFGLAGDAV
jgi:hypothetical protein